MPGYAREGDLFIASLQTGPSHVWLGLRFGGDRQTAAVLTMRPAIGACDHGKLDEGAIRKAVLEAVSSESENLIVREIEYVANDSRRYAMYARCSQLIVRHFSDEFGKIDSE